jgi:hypothetical protein
MRANAGVPRDLHYAAELPEDRYRDLGGESGTAVARGLRTGSNGSNVSNVSNGSNGSHAPAPLAPPPAPERRRSYRCGACGQHGHRRSACPQVEAQDNFIVEDILTHRTNEAGDIEYLIRWEGYTSDDDTWEPADNLQGCPRILRQYHANTGEHVS